MSPKIFNYKRSKVKYKIETKVQNDPVESQGLDGLVKSKFFHVLLLLW